MKRVPDLKLRAADTAALWHAVTNFQLMVKQMNGMEFAPLVLKQEQERAAAAMRALRKLQAILRSQKKQPEEA